MLASVADKEIEDYLGYAYDESDRQAKKTYLEDVETKDIISYLDETGWDTDNTF